VEPSSLRAIYLTGPTVYLRALVDGDKERAAAWLEETFPVNAPAAEAALKEENKAPWWSRSGLRLVIVRRDGDEVVGGVRIWWGSEARRCGLEFSMAAWESKADSVRADALRLVVPWLRDEMESMVVGVTLASDQTESVLAAREVGMERQGTLREWFGRPGGRADALRLVVPWLRDEMESMVVGVTLAADQTESVRAASEVGMEHQGTLREWFVRPGGRADARVYEALSPHWVVRDA
jgi:RimJ/RimL family protein N-acetyltransferase